MNVSRRFEIFLDGTWNTDDMADPTNVFRLYDLVDKTRPEVEVLYLRGVGTGTLRYLGGLFGVGLSEQVKEAYNWIRRNRPTDADEIHITGFSRGAYAARDLSDLLSRVGIRAAGRVDDIYDEYVAAADRRRASALLGTPPISHLLCFDTVGALGVPTPFGYTVPSAELHETTLPSHVRAATHLVAIHETRRHFSPTLFPAHPAVHEVWCPGVHSDVGGGSKNRFFADNALAYAMRRKETFGSVFLPDAMTSVLSRIVATPPRDRKVSPLKNSIFWPEKERVIPPGARLVSYA